MRLARSSFYYKSKGKSPERMKAEADLRDKVEAICLEFPRYGYRLVTREVLRLIRESGFRISPTSASGRALFTWQQYWTPILGR